MYNWNTDITELKKDKDQYSKWKIEQLVNFGLNGEKINKKLLIKYWNDLNLDPSKKKYLEYLLWQKIS